MKSFKDAMNAAANLDDLKVVPLPAGEWEVVITKIDPEAELRFDFGDTPKGTEIVQIYLKPVRALDVDEEELDQCGDWADKLLDIRLISAGDMVKLVDIANERGLVYDAGLDPNDFLTDDGIDWDEMFKELTGKHVQATIVQSVSKKSGMTMSNLKTTAPLD